MVSLCRSSCCIGSLLLLLQPSRSQAPLLVNLQHAAPNQPLEAGLLCAAAAVICSQAPARCTHQAAGAAVDAARAAACVCQQACCDLRHARPEVPEYPRYDTSLQTAHQQRWSSAADVIHVKHAQSCRQARMLHMQQCKASSSRWNSQQYVNEPWLHFVNNNSRGTHICR